MSQTLFVHYRDDGFWAFDVVSAVFLKHLIDAATSHLERHDEPWLADSISHWRFNAVCGDLGLYLDEAWSDEQLATFTGLARKACEALSKRDKIAADEIQSWQMLVGDGDKSHCFARGLPAVTTASAVRLGEAIIKLVNGTLPKPPPGTWWFFATEDSGETLRKRGDWDDAERLLAEGNDLANNGRDEDALARFRAAWAALPEPKDEQEPAIRILAAVADAHFHLSQWDACRAAVQHAFRCEVDVANPFLRLRLGQALYEIGDEQEAANWLVPAYLSQGRALFSYDDPKYLEFFRSKLKPPPGGWPEGW